MRRVLAAIVLGIAITVLNGWVCNRFWIGPLRVAYKETQAWPIEVPPDWSEHCYVTEQGNSVATTRRCCYPENVEPELHAWAGMALYFPDHEVCEYRYGWPFRTLVHYEASSDKPSIPLELGTLRSGLRWPSDWPLQAVGVDRLPIYPLWRGFVLNTCLFGLSVWLMLATPGWLRRRRRAGRGLCTACAYPVVGLNLCPECGSSQARQERARSA